ncbi:unnamed protein product [Adineta ricciae]|uniref:EGF-like domain-containing protein n=1 Tax=Adineta ricciae TaxID=249248 RepID=A0A813WA22_ADIRI|nr:unnamed protein product [Adineta ricciae]
MNITTSNTTDETNVFNRLFLLGQKLFQNRNETIQQTIMRLQNHHHQQQHHSAKSLSSTQFIEIAMLCFILIEHTFVFILTLQKKSSKELFLHTNEHHTRQTQQIRSVVLPRKYLLHNCLHRNWIRAYSFSNICLSCVYFPNLILKHYHPNLVHPSSVTFYSLPLTLLQQILINFSGFHLFIISISVLQYFIRSYRLSNTKYSFNIYNGKNLLITKHTNVALILTGSLALIFGYNYIFYTPKVPLTSSLLPLIALNMILLPTIDLLTFIFILTCCCIHVRQLKDSIKQAWSFNDPSQISPNKIRSIVERNSCLKCYSKFLQLNRNLFKDNDAYSTLHSKFFSQNLITSSRPSIASPEEKRKFSTVSDEINDTQGRLSVSHAHQPIRPCPSTRSNRSHEPSNDERVSPTSAIIRRTLMKIEKRRSLCHLCHRLLLLFLLKYALLTFPQHFIQMRYHLRQFYDYVFKYNFLNLNHNASDAHPAYPEPLTLICRFLFLAARFGDSLLLTRLPILIKDYFPCWFQFNSQLLRQEKTFQRPSHQILMKGIDTPTADPTSADELSALNEMISQQREQTTISCTPNKTPSSLLEFSVHYLKQLYTLPVYDQNEQKLEWSGESSLESQSSPTCPNGFERQGSFCHDINECHEQTNICQYMCENQIGSYRCFCPIGFKMNELGQCQDVNECQQFQIDCGQDRTCFNTQGAYECIDVPCPVNYLRSNRTDCQSKCAHRSTCSPRRAMHIRYRFIALPRLTPSNKILFTLPNLDLNKTSRKLVDRNNFNSSFPFVLDGSNLKTDQILMDSNEYELEIHVYKNEPLHRRRLSTIYIVQINVSPFHF